MIKVWMLFFAVVLQGGQPVWTTASAYTTEADCEAAREHVIEQLTMETQAPDENNAGGFVVKPCEEMEVPFTGKAGSI